MNTPVGHGPRPLTFTAFDANTFPEGLDTSSAVEYLRCYLADLGAATIIEEPSYFDRDYLAEFSAFYSTSSRGYSNSCRRLHLFSLALARLKASFDEAIAGDARALEAMQRDYLGFVVVRPIHATPLGRTVLRWYPETRPEIPRVTRPAREYCVHLAGLELSIEGLAWQQQDSGVGACATVALWTMFHSSALDEHHAVPTTVEITRSAKAQWPLTRRIFPAADGLVVDQLCQAIRAQGLLPAVLDGDREMLVSAKQWSPAFSRERFAASCAAWLRSGYPALLAVQAIDSSGAAAGGHAVCAVGFRPGPTPDAQMGEALEADGSLEHLYVHDDNLGPSVRFSLSDWVPDANNPVATVAALDAAPPLPLKRSTSLSNPTLSYWKLVPTSIIAALPEDIRMTSDFLNARALGLAETVTLYLQRAATKAATTLPGVTFSARFFKLKEYLGEELSQRLSGGRLAKARLGVVNDVRPMSLHLGVVRIGVAGTPLFDVLYDTTDSEPATAAFAHIVFTPFPTDWIDGLGVAVRTF